jgi:tetratricopeptide (TPR) repeat protein
MFQGIMAFDEKANFTGFTGTIKVNITVYEKVWRRLSTKAQRERQIQFIPTEFTSVDMAPDGFVYATNYDPKGEQSVRRLNPKGQDVIKKRKSGYLSGDLFWRIGREYSGPSRIIDVVYRGSGIYSVLDTTRGRIFTYDHEGNMLYIFGGKGSQDGTFRNPAAIEVKDDKILVLDSFRGELMAFSETRYGNLINRATALRYDGDEASAVDLWKQVLTLDSNFELAYGGIGKSLLAAGENKKAMEYFKLAMDREYYSIAFKRYRDDLLKKNLGYVLTLIIVIFAALRFRKIVMVNIHRKMKTSG